MSMTDEALDLAITRVLARAGIAVPAAEPAPFGTDAAGNPGHVAPGELIESTWGSAVADRVTHLYANTAERDAQFTTAIRGSRCNVAVPVGAQAQRGQEYFRGAGVWEPRGLMLCANLVASQSIGADDAWVPLSFSTPSHDLGNRFNGTTWTAPETGYVRVSLGCAMQLGTTAGGSDAFGDYTLFLAIVFRGTPYQIGVFKGRFAVASVSGTTVQVVSAGDTVSAAIYVSGAASKYKTVLGGANDTRQLIIDYV